MASAPGTVAADVAAQPRVARARATVAPFAAEFPFAPHFLPVVEVAGSPAYVHYLDEGPRAADPLLLVHGNPTWSFFYRRLVLAFRDRWRVVAPDHLGCGLSDKPRAWPYRLAGHAANLERLVLELDLARITLVVHDWGGPIGLWMAARHPGRIARVVIMNTAAFPGGELPRRIALCRTPLLGELLIRRFNAFARAALRMAVVKRERISPAVRRGYLAPYGDRGSRIAHHRFVADIPTSPRHPSWQDLLAVASALPRFRDRPAAIVWGERDFCFTPAFRHMWQERFPQAEVLALPEAGHWLLEDAHEEIVPWLTDFLARHPLE